MPGPFAAPTVREALESALTALRAAQLDTPRLDAELLVGHVTGLDRTRLRIEDDRELDPGAIRALRDLVRRRAVLREPVAYLVGTRAFRRLDLDVGPGVLVPRPETEHLVEWAVEHLPRGARVLDVGTGSGAIALALKDERGDLDVVASDVSAEAVAIARANVSRLGLAVEVVEGDLLAGLEGLDAVVSNPPYVEAGARLAPELSHEPREALFGGPDGLDVLRRLTAAISADGSVRHTAIEVGQGQPASVRVMLGPTWRTEVVDDLAGIGRVVVGTR